MRIRRIVPDIRGERLDESRRFVRDPNGAVINVMQHLE